jgi:hypothetical protein
MGDRMTEQQGGLAGLAAEEGLAAQARWLGQQHRSASATPFGDVEHVYWDKGSAQLLSVFGITSATTADNAPGRQRLAGAYCDALEGREPGDNGPGS